MSFGIADDSDDVMNEINMTPMVDIMLVLLIIFIITIPVMKHSVNIDLPQASNQVQNIKPETLRLSVDAQGAYFLNDAAVTDADFASRLQAASQQSPQPELHIRGDKNVRYERMAQAMATAQQVGLKKIGFITEPKR
jgi:biopolymer transport protein ExbD